MVALRRCLCAGGSSRTFKSSLETTGDLANTVKTRMLSLVVSTCVQLLIIGLSLKSPRLDNDGRS